MPGAGGRENRKQEKGRNATSVALPRVMGGQRTQHGLAQRPQGPLPPGATEPLPHAALLSTAIPHDSHLLNLLSPAEGSGGQGWEGRTTAPRTILPGWSSMASDSSMDSMSRTWGSDSHQIPQCSATADTQPGHHVTH